MTNQASIEPVRDYFLQLQTYICDRLETIDGGATFSIEDIRQPNGAHSRPRVIDNGRYIERGAVQF
ncbi:MAG: coproporphyrinogen III oxidase, partial [Patiriisocius sp.]